MLARPPHLRKADGPGASPVLGSSIGEPWLQSATAFYVALGLSESPPEPLTLMATLSDLRAAL
jgi:hypothetical protein